MNKKDQNMPLVSVVLPVYKSENHLIDSLISISNQTYQNLEIVAVVDYLGDNCLKILRRYKRADARFRIYKNVQRYGLGRTLNKALRHAKGEYIAFSDSEGLSSKYRIAKQVKFLMGSPKIAAVGSQSTFISNRIKRLGKSSYPTTHEEIYKGLMSGASFKFESALVARDRLPKDILYFKTDTRYPYLYIDVFTKIGKYAQLANLNETLVKSRIIERENKNYINIEKKLSFIKVLFESTTIHDYKPSFRSLLSPIINFK